VNGEHFETVVIGGGQAGLAAAYHLQKRGRSAVILDENERIGDAWRNRWDSLRIFTPAKHAGLPGFRIPAPGWSFPTKDELADYLESYAARFDLRVRTGVRVDRLSKADGRFAIDSGGRRHTADTVVVATGAHHYPRVPDFASELDPEIVQLHSSEYRSPSQLRDGGVLVVGVGNSGAEIAVELVEGRATWLSGKVHGQIPVRHGSRLPARIGFRVFLFLGHRVFTKGTPLGRKVGPKIAFGGAPLIRTRSQELAAAGVERVARVAGTRGGLPVLEDGRVLDVANIVWCTGFRHDFPWIDLPIFGANARPVHDRGVVSSEPGLYFVGLIFQYAVSSDVLPGVGRDAGRIAKHVMRLHRRQRPVEAAQSLGLEPSRP
jgi:putative flavoprotein involved in K+ transport